MNRIQTDREIVRRVLRGDLECFSGLVGEYAPRMLNLALGIVHRREVAEDIVQDALVKAYEGLGGWRGESSLSSWLYRIVYTTAISSLRGRKDLPDDSDAMLQRLPAGDDGEWEVTGENISKMRRALEMLPPLDRTMVNLFYLEEKPVREVAMICSESEANVKTRLHRARARLRRLINEIR